MTSRELLPKRVLVFKTIREGDTIYCGVKDNGRHVPHKLAKDRKGNGHEPGYVYLARVPKYEGGYKIGKAEQPKSNMDDFILDKKDPKLLRALKKRLGNYHPARSETDAIYDGAQFVHGICVACAEGAEKQPHSFFTQNKWPKLDRELYKLTEADIEAFKTATGSVLGRPIEHLTAEEFAHYLAKDYKFSEATIREWVFLPENKEITVNGLKECPIVEENDRGIPSPTETAESLVRNVTKPRITTRPVATHRDSKATWYAVNGAKGSELPTLFERCIKAFQQQGPINVALRKGINANEKISQFKSHWRYKDYATRYKLTLDDWEIIFGAVRSAKTLTDENRDEDKPGQ